MEPRFTTFGRALSDSELTDALTCEPVGAFESLTESLRNTSAFANDTALHIERLADRLFGSVTQPVERADKDAAPHSQVGAAQDQAAALHRQIVRIAEAVGRLSSL